MGVYIKEENEYTIKYKDNQFNDLKNIFNEVYHYFYEDYGKWIYIDDEDKISKRFEDDEFDILDCRNVNIDTNKQTISICGIYEREHGEGTHLEVNEELLYKKLFEYDQNILIIKRETSDTDASYDGFYCSNEIIYMNKNKIESVCINDEASFYIDDFDNIVKSSDLKYFLYNNISNPKSIDEYLSVLNPLNIEKYYDIVEDYLSEKDIIKFIKKSFTLINYIDYHVADKIINDYDLMVDILSNINLNDLNMLDDELLELIIENEVIIYEAFDNRKDVLNYKCDEDSILYGLIENYKKTRKKVIKMKKELKKEKNKKEESIITIEDEEIEEKIIKKKKSNSNVEQLSLF